MCIIVTTARECSTNQSFPPAVYQHNLVNVEVTETTWKREGERVEVDMFLALFWFALMMESLRLGSRTAGSPQLLKGRASEVASWWSSANNAHSCPSMTSSRLSRGDKSACSTGNGWLITVMLQRKYLWQTEVHSTDNFAQYNPSVRYELPSEFFLEPPASPGKPFLSLSRTEKSGGR